MANSGITWNDVASQVDNFSDAGRLGVLASMGLGQAFADTGKAFSDMHSEAAARDALQFLAQSWDTNNRQSINEAMPLALASNPGMSSEMLKYLTGAGRTLMNTQLDADNLAVEKERVKAAQNAIDAAVANADTKAARAANEAMKALNVRADARTYGNVDALLTSQAQRAKVAADIAATKAVVQETLIKRRQEGASYAMAEALNSVLPEVDLSTPAGKEVAFAAANELGKNLPSVDGLTEAAAYNIKLKALEIVQQMRANGAVPTGNVGLAGTRTASFIDEYGREIPFSWDYDLNPLVPAMPQQVAVQTAMGQRLPATAIPNKAATRAQLKEQEQIAKAAQTLNNVMSMGRTATAIPYQTPNVGGLAGTYAQATGTRLPTAEQALAIVQAQEDARKARLEAADRIEEEEIMNPYLASIISFMPNSSGYVYYTGADALNEKKIQLVNQVRSGKAISKEQAASLSEPQKVAVKLAQEQAAMSDAQQSQSDALTDGFALRDAFTSTDITPQGQAKTQRDALKFKKSFDQSNRDVDAVLNQTLSTDVDTANSRKTAEATRAAFNYLLGLTSDGLPTDILNLKSKDGKALTKEEILSLDEDGYFDAFVNGKDWSDTEKGTAYQYYTDLVEFYKQKFKDPTLAYLLSIANLSDFNEHNSGLTRFFGDNEDFQGGEEIMQLAYRVADTLTNSDSKMYQTLLRQAQLADILKKGAEAIKAMEAANTALYNMQVKNKTTGRSTPLDTFFVDRILQDRKAAAQLGFTSIDSVLRGMSQPY